MYHRCEPEEPSNVEDLDKVEQYVSHASTAIGKKTILLDKAVNAKNLEAIKLLIKFGADPFEFGDEEVSAGCPPIFTMAHRYGEKGERDLEYSESGNEELMTALINQVNFKKLNEKQKSLVSLCIGCACTHADVGIVRCLLKHACVSGNVMHITGNPDDLSSNVPFRCPKNVCSTALGTVCLGCPDDLLQPEQRKQIRARRTEIIRLLIKYRVDVNEIEEASNFGIALHLAAMSHMPQAVKMLLEAGANGQGQDSTGCTPLMEACKQVDEDSLETIKVLVNAGMRLETKTSKMYTALVYLACNACVKYCATNTNAIKVLLAAGANPNITYSPQNYPSRGRERLITSLIVTAVVNAKQCEESLGPMKALIQYNCDINTSNKVYLPRDGGRDAAHFTATPFEVALFHEKKLNAARVLAEAGTAFSIMSSCINLVSDEIDELCAEKADTEFDIKSDWDRIQQIASNPRSLMHASRLCVRQCLDRRIIYVDRLSLPKNIRDFVMLEDLFQ